MEENLITELSIKIKRNSKKKFTTMKLITRKRTDKLDENRE